jgi:AcrR family transcriptional regulator
MLGGHVSPTGVRIEDARRQLFDAAEIILRMDGPSGLTSRAVTDQAGVAKGVLHRHFADFDAFLAELVADRTARVEAQAAALRASAGTGSVTGNLAAALIELFDAVAIGIVGLVIFRDDLRARLSPGGNAPYMPVLTEAGVMIAGYLTAECELGRVAADADAGSLAVALLGAGHLLFADRRAAPPAAGSVEKAVNAIAADILQRRLL